MIQANAPISEFMTRIVLTAAPGETVAAVAGRMKEAGIHHVPVLDGGALVGIVSALDLLRVPRDERASHPVSEVMSCEVETLDVGTSLREVLTRFSQVSFNAFPVVEAGQLVGIVTSVDLEELLYRDW